MTEDPQTAHWPERRRRGWLGARWKYEWRWYIGGAVGLAAFFICLGSAPRYSFRFYMASAVGASVGAGVERLLTALFPPPPPSWRRPPVD